MIKDKPILIIVGGFAGTGKTMLSKKLAKHFSITRLGVDDFGRMLKPKKFLNRFDTDCYKLAYELVFASAKSSLAVKTSSIADINMCNPLSWQEIEKIKSQVKNARILIILLQCSFDTSTKRVEKRRLSDPDNYDIGKHNIKEVRYKYKFIEDKIKNNESPDIVVINTDKKPQRQVLTEAIQELKKRGIK